MKAIKGICFHFFLSRFKSLTQGRHNIERKIYHIRFRLLRLLKFGREVTSKRRISDHWTKIE